MGESKVSKPTQATVTAAVINLRDEKSENKPDRLTELGREAMDVGSHADGLLKEMKRINT